MNLIHDFTGVYTKLKEIIKRRILLHCEKSQNKINESVNKKNKLVVGPVFSSNLGVCLDVNNIGECTCTYGCNHVTSAVVKNCTTAPVNYYDSYELYFCVRKRLKELENLGIIPDYIHFNPQGESTLDVNLHLSISLLREFGIKIAVSTNGTLLWNDNIKQNLLSADCVILKLDTVSEDSWHSLNCPNRCLDLEMVADGISSFAKQFRGKLLTETNIVEGYNDTEKDISALSVYLNKLRRTYSYFYFRKDSKLKGSLVLPSYGKIIEQTQIIKNKISNVVIPGYPGIN